MPAGLDARAFERLLTGEATQLRCGAEPFMPVGGLEAVTLLRELGVASVAEPLQEPQYCGIGTEAESEAAPGEMDNAIDVQCPDVFNANGLDDLPLAPEGDAGCAASPRGGAGTVADADGFRQDGDEEESFEVLEAKNVDDEENGVDGSDALDPPLASGSDAGAAVSPGGGAGTVAASGGSRHDRGAGESVEESFFEEQEESDVKDAKSEAGESGVKLECDVTDSVAGAHGQVADEFDVDDFDADSLLREFGSEAPLVEAMLEQGALFSHVYESLGAGAVSAPVIDDLLDCGLGEDDVEALVALVAAHFTTQGSQSSQRQPWSLDGGDGW